MAARTRDRGAPSCLGPRPGLARVRPRKPCERGAAQPRPGPTPRLHATCQGFPSQPLHDGVAPFRGRRAGPTRQWCFCATVPSPFALGRSLVAPRAVACGWWVVSGLWWDSSPLSVSGGRVGDARTSGREPAAFRASRGSARARRRDRNPEGRIATRRARVRAADALYAGALRNACAGSTCCGSKLLGGPWPPRTAERSLAMKGSPRETPRQRRRAVAHLHRGRLQLWGHSGLSPRPRAPTGAGSLRRREMS